MSFRRYNSRRVGDNPEFLSHERVRGALSRSFDLPVTIVRPDTVVLLTGILKPQSFFGRSDW